MSSVIKKLKESTLKSSTSPMSSPQPQKDLKKTMSALSMDSKSLKTKDDIKLKKIGSPASTALGKEASSIRSTSTSPLPPKLPLIKKKYGLKDIIIERTLGTGSFGRVHLMKLKETGQYHALKVLRKSDIIRMRQLEHTINERSILQELDHPFLVKMIGTFQDTENVYFILEYIQGGELFSYLRKYVRFPNHVARFYAAEVLLAFETLHSKNIIYRDLKPEEGHIKITDFGFAKVVNKETWTLCGTPDYLAPEIIQSKGYGYIYN